MTPDPRAAVMAAVSITWRQSVYDEDGNYDGVSVGYHDAETIAASMLAALEAAGYRVVRQREAAIISGDWVILEFRDMTTINDPECSVWVDVPEGEPNVT